MSTRLVLLFCTLLLAGMTTIAAAEEKGTIQVAGVGTVTIPADTVIIDVSVRTSGENLTQAAAEADELLEKTKKALRSAGVKESEIIPGSSQWATRYYQLDCHEVDNVTRCRNVATNLVTGRLEVRLKRDDAAKVDRVIERTETAGARAVVTGYALSDTRAGRDEARKAAVENARMNAQDYAWTYGLTLGKVVDVYEPVLPTVFVGHSYGMVGPSRWHHRPFRGYNLFGMGPFWRSGNGMPGTLEVTAYALVTYEIS